MKLKQFILVILFIGLVASVFSPSSLNAAMNSQGAFTSSKFGLTNFVSLLGHQGYKVEIANTTQQELSYAGTQGAVFFVIDPDTALSSSEAQTLFSLYQAGSLSLVLVEGNTTNEAAILSKFGASVTGAAILDNISSFQDHRVFNVTLNLGTPTVGTIDIGSPIILNNSPLTPVAQSSHLSTDSKNSTAGPRIVAAADLSSSSSKAILIDGSSPFTNCLLGKCSGLNDTAFVESVTNWASDGNTSRLIVIDGSHYVSSTPPIGPGLPIGWIMLLLLKGVLSFFGGGFGFGELSAPASSFSLFGFTLPRALLSVFELIIALSLLYFVYGRIKAWFATEKVVKDDQPLPIIERDFVSESQERLNFLAMSRNKSFYVATLAQLYGVIDDVTKLELGQGIKDMSMELLVNRLGAEKGAKAYNMLQELTRYYDFANSKSRFMFPPVVFWKRKVGSITKQAEQFLNDLGMSMAGKGAAKQIEYALKR